MSAGPAPTELPFTHADLAAPVVMLLAAPSAPILDLRAEPLGAGFGGGTAGLYRISGNARLPDGERPWALVLKVLRPRAGALANAGDAPAVSGLEPHHYNYWRREALAYRSGLLDSLPGTGAANRLRAPHCFGVVDRPDGSVWLWLEALDDSAGRQWSTARYALAARHLGRFNGAYAAPAGKRPLPDDAFLSRGLLRSWLRRWPDVATEALTSFSWADLRVHAATGDAQRTHQRVQRLAEAQEQLLGDLKRLPQTLCHLDAFRRNLLAAAPASEGGDGDTVAIDWAFVGIAAPGEEVAQLVAASLFFGDAVAADELGTAAFDAYLAGLGEAGWAGDPKLVRFAYAASAALRWTYFAAMRLLRQATATEERRAEVERETGKPFGDLLAGTAALLLFLLDRAEEAFSLRAQVVPRLSAD